MSSLHPSDALVPVVCDADQLDAYLAACAASRTRPVLDALLMTRSAWIERAAGNGEAAWEHATKLGLPLIDLMRVPQHPDVKKIFPDTAARRLHATPILSAHGYLAVAVDPGTDESMVSTLGFVTNQPVVALVSTTQARLGNIGPHDDHDEDQLIALQMGIKLGQREAQRVEQEDELAAKWTMIQAMRSLVASAVRLRASDIHISPGPKSYEVLFRIDGNMVHQRNILRDVAALVLNRVKVFADMDIAEHRRPQDGRGTYQLDDTHSVDLRISIIPTVLGESVVVRLLDTEESLKTIDQIELPPDDRAVLDELMSRSHGLFLATGPTGCGKSTTLYAVLQELRRKPINILTVEDPVEYTLTGIRQMEVNTKIDVSFANALRGFLRHDPDVIMVGEIRDRETARMAVESSLTGHLVLSTLHTNTAATTVTRLLELGVEAFLLRAALTGVMAQRLVRLTCDHCRIKENPAPYFRAALGVGDDEEFTIGRGCDRCHHTGVFRRCAVYELMRITPAIRELIAPGVEADRIHAAALAGGMIPITQAAVRMARNGRISLAEAYRIRAD
ncbi:GspE/PulE family protein [Lysobacter claricitrinus]|uniref:GspE/PulE family protein n=1 Tax=Lysobacter claricitrinus TaxID=3367728 RepID=UPI0037DACC93